VYRVGKGAVRDAPARETHENLGSPQIALCPLGYHTLPASGGIRDLGLCDSLKGTWGRRASMLFSLDHPPLRSVPGAR
jgi:hypothetical protein